MVPDKIERETFIAAPVERVWALITEAEHLGRWFGDAGAEIPTPYHGIPQTDPAKVAPMAAPYAARWGRLCAWARDGST